MEKNVKVINPKGVTIKVADHMVSDMLKHGCTLKTPTRKDAPEELRRPIKLPEAKIIKPEPAKDSLPPMESSAGEQGRGSELIKSDLPVNDPTKPKRKSPVRSKSTK